MLILVAYTRDEAGSGITRALKFTPDIKFVNDETLNEFVVTMERKGADDRDNDRVDDRDKPLENSNLKETGQQCNDRDDRVMISIGSQMIRANAVF